MGRSWEIFGELFRKKLLMVLEICEFVNYGDEKLEFEAWNVKDYKNFPKEIVDNFQNISHAISLKFSFIIHYQLISIFEHRVSDL